MQVLEDAVPVRPREPIDGIDGAFGVAGAIERPRRQQRRGQIGDRAADRLREIRACRDILFLMQRAQAEHEPRDAIVAIDLDDALRELAGLFHIALGQDGKEGAAEQFGVARIELERVAIVGGGGDRVALGAGMTRGEVAARLRRMRELLRRRSLRRKRGRQTQGRGGQNECRRVPEQRRLNHDISI